MRLCLVIITVYLINNGLCKYNKRADNSKSSMEYYTRSGQRLIIPVIIHFDKALTDKLAKGHRIRTRKKLKEISWSILKEAEGFFRHPSLNHSIHISLQDTRFLRKNTVEMEENGSIYIKKYCTWQAERKSTAKRWWFSILLTGLDIFYVNGRGEEVRTSTGRGYLGGICARTKSCSLLEFDSSNMGYLLAHEIGHSLGLTHDGTPHNSCRPHQHIMTSKYHPRYHPKTWSRCSKIELQRFLKSRKSRCIQKNHRYN